MQAIRNAARQATQGLKCSKVHTFCPMLLNQLKEWFLLKTTGGCFPGTARLPLQVLQYPTPIITGLDARSNQSSMAQSQTFAPLSKGLGQGMLSSGYHFKFDHLGKAQAACWNRHGHCLLAIELAMRRQAG